MQRPPTGGMGHLVALDPAICGGAAQALDVRLRRLRRHVFASGRRPLVRLRKIPRRHSAWHVAFLDATSDSTFDQISTLISADPRTSGFGDRERADLVQAAAEVVYDPAPDGESFVIHGSPGCPSCGAHTVASFTSTDDDWSASGSVMTHHQWDRLSNDGRRQLITAFLDRVLNCA
jgi:hypothetical protein